VEAVTHRLQEDPLSKEPANIPAELPAEYDRWNWGAFLLNWIWGIGNSVFIALLMFVPLVNIVMLFVLGARGSRWAWRNRLWRDLDHFRSVQRKWAIAGFCLVGFFFLVAAGIVFFVQAMIKDSDAFKLTMERLRAEPEIAEKLGADFAPGWIVSGNISYNAGGSGEASLNIPLSGSRGSARAFSEARRENGTWTLERLSVRLADSQDTIRLSTP